VRLIRWAIVHALDLVAGAVDRALDVSFDDTTDTASRDVR
jgi:hypothetical protein